MKYRSALLVVLLVIVADQLSKFYIKTHFWNGREINVIGDWCRLHFLENEGMAFGMKISQTDWGKLLLTVFRLVAVIFGFFLLKRLVKRRYSRGLIICGALILAGAMGNLIDSMFYGLIFTDSPYDPAYVPHTVAHLVPWGHGYGRFLHGRVVDMFYFPIWENIHFPKWIPVIGDKYYTFFADVFNVADASISIGVLTLIFFQKRLLKHKNPTPPEPLPTTEVPAT